MSDTLQFLRANPGMLAILTLLSMGTVVFGLVGYSMVRSGMSVRPVIFIAGFFAIVVVPQAAFHASQAFGLIPRKDLVWLPGGPARNATFAARTEVLRVSGGRFADPHALFGPDVDTDLVSDLRDRLPDIFGPARAAEMVVLRTMATVVVAQFESRNAATAALNQYAMAMVGALPPMDENGLYTVSRVNDFVRMLVADETLIVYSAPTTAALDVMLASSPVIRKVAPLTADAAPEYWLYRPAVLATIVVILVIVAALWFFRMSTWATEVPAARAASRTTSVTLRERLMAINALDVPFTISPFTTDSTALVATWRYADTKWMDQARAHGLRRTFRIILNLDETNRTVRPTEQIAAMNWDAGPSGATFNWVTARGITFFQYEHQRVFGLQMDSAFTFTAALSYTYTFNLQEMKAPIIQAVTQSGWRWRPVMLQGPSWLSWLTN